MLESSVVSGDTSTPTHPWLEPLVRLHLFVLHTSLWESIGLGAGAKDEGGGVITLCVLTVCENTAGTAKLDGVYTVPAAQ